MDQQLLHGLFSSYVINDAVDNAFKGDQTAACLWEFKATVCRIVLKLFKDGVVFLGSSSRVTSPVNILSDGVYPLDSDQSNPKSFGSVLQQRIDSPCVKNMSENTIDVQETLGNIIKSNSGEIDKSFESIVIGFLNSDLYEVRQMVLRELIEIHDTNGNVDLGVSDNNEDNDTDAKEANIEHGLKIDSSGVDETKGDNLKGKGSTTARECRMFVESSTRIHESLLKLVETETNEECLQHLFRFDALNSSCLKI